MHVLFEVFSDCLIVIAYINKIKKAPALAYVTISQKCIHITADRNSEKPLVDLE